MLHVKPNIGRFNRFAVFAVSAAAADIATKILAVALLEKDNILLFSDMPVSVEVIRNRTPYKNWIWQEAGWIGIAYAMGMLALLIMASRSMRSRQALAAKGLIAGGAAGNFACRIIRKPGFGDGHVVDWIKVADDFWINLADVFILTGIAMLLTVRISDTARAEKAERRRKTETDAVIP